MRIVTPYRPFVAESEFHKEVGAFDWVGAIDMLRESARRACGLEVVAITDVDTLLPPPALQYRTTHRRLMPWIIEIAYRYIASADFDQDTIMISPDMLVFGNPGRWFESADFDFDLGLLAREDPINPMLNSVQFWPHRSHSALRRLYAAVMETIPALPEEELVWGGDTTPFVNLFGPAVPGRVRDVPEGRVRFFDADEVLTTFREPHFRKALPTQLLDFRFRRKFWMREYFKRKLAP